MMYFSETHWTLPDMDVVVRAFDEEHDRIEYERKVGRLARAYSREARRNHPRDYGDWQAALSKLRTEDHYVLVMAEPTRDSESVPRSPFAKLILIGFLLAVPVLVIVYFCWVSADGDDRSIRLFECEGRAGFGDEGGVVSRA